MVDAIVLEFAPLPSFSVNSTREMHVGRQCVRSLVFKQFWLARIGTSDVMHAPSATGGFVSQTVFVDAYHHHFSIGCSVRGASRNNLHWELRYVERMHELGATKPR